MKLTNDLSVLTTIPESKFNRLVTLSNQIIANSFYEQMLADSEIAECNIGIGMLYIKNVDGVLKFKFTPSQQLSDILTKASTTWESPLEIAVEESLKASLEHTYKDLL